MHVETTKAYTKPLPALLAPPPAIYGKDNISNSSFFSSTSSITIQPEEYDVVQKQSQEIQDLRNDLQTLNQKYMTQMNRANLVESELEDLSLNLFEQANDMVSRERKENYFTKKKLGVLERKLASVYEELVNERAQLNELRSKVHTEQITVANTEEIGIDEGWLGLFKDFLLMAPSTPLEQLYKLPFMKQCLELDIEPCLRLRRISSKKILDAVLKQPCFIEPDRRASFPLSPPKHRKQSTFSFLKTTHDACSTCGASLTNQQRYKFKLKETDLDYMWIDRGCRDRLVAVCEFYVFVRHVKSGLLSSQKTIQQLFLESVWLRCCMFWARSGMHNPPPYNRM